jgi:hypothetical protein
MRILSISSSYPPYANGRNAQLAAEISDGLRQRGHDVHLLTIRPAHGETRVEGHIHYALEADVNEASRVPQWLQFFLLRRSRERRNVAYLQKMLSEFRPDVTVIWSLQRLQRRLAWIVEQTLDTRAVYYSVGGSPLQPDRYSAYWMAFPQKHGGVPFGRLISRVALRQIRLENPGVLRLDFVMCASEDIRHALCEAGVLPLDSLVAHDLDEVEAVLERARAHRRLGLPLPPARARPLFDLKRWTSRPLKLSNDLHQRLDDDQHLALAAQWLQVAQDMTGNGGLAQLYNTAKREWTPAYPETTGYAIPTLLHYAHQTRGEQLRERVQHMAQFLLSVQLADGSVPVVNNEMFKVVQPCAFDIGQVIYGYLTAYQEFNQPDYLEAARRAGDWLIRDQEADGSWQRYTYHNVVHAWEVRISWALLQLACASEDQRYAEAARRNIAWTCAQQHADGWFDHLALVPGEAAVMHTIAYTLEGLLECGAHLNDAGAIDAARRPADVLLEHQRADGALPGAYTDGWRSRDHFTCLTGNAQMAIVWQRLYQLTGDEKYLGASDRLIDHVCRSQLVRTSDRNLLGSVPGSSPLDGDYLPNSLPNWAVKFLMDALLLRQAIRRERRAAVPPPR